jgi:hypothetical protein
MAPTERQIAHRVLLVHDDAALRFVEAGSQRQKERASMLGRAENLGAAQFMRRVYSRSAVLLQARSFPVQVLRT